LALNHEEIKVLAEVLNDKWEIDLASIRFVKKLGAGQFCDGFGKEYGRTVLLPLQ